MTAKYKKNKFKNLLILGILWLFGAICDRIWFFLDHSTPAWDQADYLTGTLNYQQALQNPQWFNSEWWHNFWLLSSKIPPFTYIVTALVQNIFGTGPDQATLVMLLFSAILLGSVYGLGKVLFDESVGLWAAAICQILPALYQLRLDFLLDYPLASVVTFSFFCLTVWRVRGGGEGERGRGGRRVWGDGCGRQGEFLTSSSSPTPPLPPSPHPPISPQPHGVGAPSPPSLLWAAAFGLSLGLALIVKQTALFFLLTPMAWVGFGALWKRRWGRVAQLFGALCLSVLVFGPWYRTNWLIILTSGKRATIDSAIAEGDAPLNTLQAWTYYWHKLPFQVSLPLLLVPIFGLLIYWGRLSQKAEVERRRERRRKRQGDKGDGCGDKENSPPLPISPSFLIPTPWGPPLPPLPTSYALKWLAIFWVGAYLLSSLNMNKDDRYVLPYLPVLSVFLAYGLTRARSMRGKRIRWGTFGLAIILMLLNLFGVGGVLGGWMTLILSPNAQHYPYMGQELPHRQVIAQIIQTEPYLRSTLGVLPSTAGINQHNFNYYGALQNFQVYGRQVGTRKKFVEQDVRSLSWFLTKSGNQGSIQEPQATIVQAIETSPDFQLNKSWKLPDGNLLNLYHQKLPPIEVKPVGKTGETPMGVTLSQVTAPEKAPPGKPIPVTYQWSGSWDELRQGLVLLTWRNTGNPKSIWLHDHGIGMGALHPGSSQKSALKSQHFSVVEKLAMLPNADTVPGTYTLEAIYLNRFSGESYAIPVPKVTLQIDSQAAATPAPELDLLTQLRTLAANLPKGTKALETVFDEVGRINQYDPIQDYLEQARLTLAYRLQHAPNRDWAYGLALANVLQQRIEGAIASLKLVTKLDSENPYAWAYLAFVQLYNFQPGAAQKSLQPSLVKNPNFPELKALSGVAALMQGNVVKAWQDLSVLREERGRGGRGAPLLVGIRGEGERGTRGLITGRLGAS